VSKRFTDTQKWMDPWFAELNPEQKLLWLYLCDMCDNSGVFDMSEKIARTLIGGDADIRGNLASLSDKTQVLPNGKIFITDFVNFQFGKLSEHSNLHKSIIQCIKKNKIDHHFFKGTRRVPEGYLKGIGKGKGKGKGKGIVKSDSNFEKFWKSYPKKIGKGAARTAWDKLKVTDDLTDRIITAVEQQKKSQQWTKENGQFIPHPATWLNQSRWEDEVEVKNEQPKPKCVICGKPSKVRYCSANLCELDGACHKRWNKQQNKRSAS